jgi:hypothetical protein
MEKILVHEFANNYIPRIKLMIEKEEAHIKSLREKKTKIENFSWIRRLFYSTSIIEECILENEVHLHRLENSLAEYVEYHKKLAK